MRIMGPALGLRGELRAHAGELPLRVEGEFAAGPARYSSPVSGDIDGVRRIGSMLHLRAARADPDLWMPQAGIGVTTEWTDLRGTSSLGKRGYERFNLALWLSASWDLERENAAGATVVRAAILLQGWQRSMLSQANSDYLNVTNRQRRGALLSVERPFRIESTHASIRLGLREVGRSNLVAAGTDVYAYEPTNRTVDLTVTVWR